MPANYSRNPGPDDLYGDGAEGSPAEEARETPAEERSEGKTYVVPSDICPGMKPGDEMVTKIVAVHDGEYEIAYAPEKGGKSETPEQPAEAPAGYGGGEMASMME